METGNKEVWMRQDLLYHAVGRGANRSGVLTTTLVFRGTITTKRLFFKTVQYPLSTDSRTTVWNEYGSVILSVDTTRMKQMEVNKWGAGKKVVVSCLCHALAFAMIAPLPPDILTCPVQEPFFPAGTVCPHLVFRYALPSANRAKAVRRVLKNGLYL